MAGLYWRCSCGIRYPNFDDHNRCRSRDHSQEERRYVATFRDNRLAAKLDDLICEEGGFEELLVKLLDQHVKMS